MTSTINERFGQGEESCMPFDTLVALTSQKLIANGKLFFFSDKTANASMIK